MYLSFYFLKKIDFQVLVKQYWPFPSGSYWAAVVLQKTPGNLGITFPAVPGALGVAEEPTLYKQERSKRLGHLAE